MQAQPKSGLDPGMGCADERELPPTAKRRVHRYRQVAGLVSRGVDERDSVFSWARKHSAMGPTAAASPRDPYLSVEHFKAER